MADQGQRPGPDWSKYPRWVAYVPGLLGGAWLIGGLSWVLWARILPANMSVLAKATQAGVCLGGIAFAVSALWPSPGQGRLTPGDIPEFWSFVRGGPPQDARHGVA